MKYDFRFVVLEKDENKRLDIYLTENIKKMSRSKIIKSINEKKVFVNKIHENKSYRVKKNDIVFLKKDKKEIIDLLAENLNIKILYEDTYLMVVEKPKGMVVYPTKEYENATLANGLLGLGRNLSDYAGSLRPGIVHRLDKDTSGAILIAKNNDIHRKLVDLMVRKEIKREYEGVSMGSFAEKKGRIDIPIGRHPKNRVIMSEESKKLKYAITEYEVLAEFENYSYLRLRLDTGRKHQIRVHLNSINRPLAGEKIYNNRGSLPPLEKKLKGQCLHAKTIGFCHPVSKEWTEIDCDLPIYFRDFLDEIR